MVNMQVFADKTAISLSLLCAIHCLAVPLLIVVLPSLAALPLTDEAFHLWILAAVVPTSLLALIMGCRKHKQYRVAMAGAFGLLIMVAALLLEETLGEYGEKALTLTGASFIAVSHLWNYRRCRHHACQCTAHAQPG